MVRISLFILVIFALVPAADALTINIEPGAINGSFANSNTHITVTVPDASNETRLWYKTLDGVDTDVTNLMGISLPLNDYIGYNLTECSSHNVTFFANDSNSSAEAYITVTYDGKPPEGLALALPDQSVYFNSTVRVEWNHSTDACSGMRTSQTYSTRMDCVNYSNEIYTNDNKTIFDVPLGSCTVYVSAYDNVESIMTSNHITVSKNFTFDTMGPSIIVLSPPAKVYSGEIWFNLSLNRPANCTLNNGSQNLAMNVDGTNLTVKTSMSEGDHTVYFNCTDAYGLNSTEMSSFAVDLSPPNKTLIGVGSDSSSPYNVTTPVTEIKLTLNEQGSCRMSEENKSFVDMAEDVMCTTTNGTEMICKMEFPDGTHTVYIACSDGFNHDNTTRVLKVDFGVKVYYELGINMDTDGYVRAGNTRDYVIRLVNNGQGNLTGTNISLSTSISSEWYNLTKNSVGQINVGGSSSITLTAKIPDTAETNDYSFTVKVVSNQINKSAEFTIEVKAKQVAETVVVTSSGSGSDGTPPKILSMFPNDVFINSRTVEVWIKTDIKSTCKMDGDKKEFDNSKIDLESDSFGLNHSLDMYSLPGGVNKFYIFCRSVDGAVMKDPSIMKFTVDVAFPITKIDEIKGDDTNYEISWSGEDDVSGLESYTIQIKTDDGAWEDWLKDTTKNFSIFIAERGHTYSLRSIGKDRAGNIEIKLVSKSDVEITTEPAEIVPESNGLTGLLTNLEMPNLEWLKNAWLFIQVNSAAFVALLGSLIVLTLVVKKPAPPKRNDLRRGVVDEWRKIKKSLK